MRNLPKVIIMLIHKIDITLANSMRYVAKVEPSRFYYQIYISYIRHLQNQNLMFHHNVLHVRLKVVKCETYFVQI